MILIFFRKKQRSVNEYLKHEMLQINKYEYFEKKIVY